MDRSVKDRRKTNPRDKANILSLLTFSYTIRIFKKAFKNDLDDEDLYEVVRSCESKKMGDKMENEYNLLKKKNKKPSIYRLIWNGFGTTYLMLGFVHLCWKMMNSVLEPEALGKVVSYFKNGDSERISRTNAIYYALILIGLKVGHCFYFQNYIIWLQTLAIQIRTSFCSLIYRKSLRLTPSAFLDVSLGNIVTLITKDVQTFEHSIWLFNDLWIAAIQTGTICYLIYSRMGFTSFIGVSILFLVMPLQIFMGKVVGNLRLKINKKTDERLQITQESLSAIKIIKMYVWQKFFEGKISAARKNEINFLLKNFFLKFIIVILGLLCSKLGFYVLIMCYVWMGNITSAELIFYVFSHFHTLQHAIGIIIPFGLGRVAELLAALSRLNHILLAEELEKIQDEDDAYPVKNPKIEVKNILVKIKEKTAINGITLSFEPGLTIVTGHLGCGKSSLLKTILRDYPLNSGDLNVKGRISYASQDPWLFPASIKQNILFGQEYNESRYKEVIKVCALEFDFELFENRDETIVADKGLNLSKGQQARINLARAIYKDSEIYLLDDSLTALDPRVQDYIFKACIQEYLKERNSLCVFVTHNAKHIEAADKLVILDKGAVKYSGKPTEIAENELLKAIEEDIEKKEDVAEDVPADEECKLLESDVEIQVKKNIYREVKKKGGVDLSVYKRYIQFGGGFILFFGLLIMYGVSQFAESYSSKVLSTWVDYQQNITDAILKNLTNTTDFIELKDNNDRALNMYTITTFSSVTLEIVKYYIFLRFATRASVHIHKHMIKNMMNAVMWFFDNHFIGNILNRFSQDLNLVDEQLPSIITHVVRICFRSAGIVILIAVVNWRFLFPSITFFLILIALRIIYMPAGRSLKRLEAASRSPMVGHLNASLEGITTIRAYKAQQVLKDEFDRHQDLFTSANYTSFYMKRAFGFYMDGFSAIYISLIIMRFLLVDTTASAGSVGLVITQVLSLAQVIQWGLMQWSDLENLMTSVERLLEYTKLSQESSDGQTLQNWPEKGRVEFMKVSLTYANSHKQVLKDINFCLEPGEKVGIVGRTGAGKSSIISTLFRLYNFEGKIEIDGVNTKTLNLDFLRKHISIIPQDPVLFAGTIRSNMDPMTKYTDAQIWKALESVHMKDSIESLEMEIKENDSTFSTGQRQLICIARAIIRKNMIVVLDEATANMDPETENLIQKTIKDNFQDCSVFIIAHRLQSVLDCNKVLVMDKGEIIEWDDPMKLLENTKGTFYNMVKQAGLLGVID